MKDILLYITIFSLLLSCSNKQSNGDKIKWDALISRKIPDDSLLFYTYKTEAPENIITKRGFNTLKEFPSSWIGLSKNSIGLFVYHRGNGFNDHLTITEDTLRNGGSGETVSWAINKFKKDINNTYYFDLGLDTISSIFAKCNIQILDIDTLYAIQSTKIYKRDSEGLKELLAEYSGVYIPEFNGHMFNHINEPNKKDPSSWIPNESIDIKSLEKRKTGNNNTYK